MDSSNWVQRHELPNAPQHLLDASAISPVIRKLKAWQSIKSRKSLRFRRLRPLLLRKDFNFQPNQLES